MMMKDNNMKKVATTTTTTTTSTPKTDDGDGENTKTDDKISNDDGHQNCCCSDNNYFRLIPLDDDYHYTTKSTKLDLLNDYRLHTTSLDQLIKETNQLLDDEFGKGRHVIEYNPPVNNIDGDDDVDNNNNKNNNSNEDKNNQNENGSPSSWLPLSILLLYVQENNNNDIVEKSSGNDKNENMETSSPNNIKNNIQVVGHARISHHDHRKASSSALGESLSKEKILRMIKAGIPEFAIRQTSKLIGVDYDTVMMMTDDDDSDDNENDNDNENDDFCQQDNNNNNNNKPLHCLIDALVVHPQYRKKGFGRILAQYSTLVALEKFGANYIHFYALSNSLVDWYTKLLLSNKEDETNDDGDIATTTTTTTKTKSNTPCGGLMSFRQNHRWFQLTAPTTTTRTTKTKEDMLFLHQNNTNNIKELIEIPNNIKIIFP